MFRAGKPARVGAMGRPVAIALLCLVGMLSPREARACSCLAGSLGRGQPSGPSGLGWVTVSGPAPAETRGAVFALGQAPSAAAMQELAAATRAERIDGERATPMRVDVEPLRDDLVLVVPHERMLPGEVWRFVSVRPGRDEGAEESAVELALRTTPTPESGLAVEVVIAEPSTGALDVAASASCSVALNAVQRRLEVRLPEELRGTEGAWLFYTEVDARDWKPRSSLCQTVASGRTWTALGTDLLFASCPTPGLLAGSPVSSGLKPGSHSVRVRVVLPGTRLSLKPKPVATTLQCAP